MAKRKPLTPKEIEVAIIEQAKKKGQQEILDAFRDREVHAAMRGVTIPAGQEPDGAVAALWRVLKRLEWKTISIPAISSEQHKICLIGCEQAESGVHAPDCELDAALRRFEVGMGDASTRDGDGPRGQ